MKKTDTPLITILIAEDEEGFRRIYGDALEIEGFEVLRAANGTDAWEILRKRKPDIVILDIILPGINGLDVLRMAKQESETKKIPIIVFSILSEQSDIKRAMQLGADDYACKGKTPPKELIRMIYEIVERNGKNRYAVEVKHAAADGMQLAADINLENGFFCPTCNCTVQLELIRDPTRTDGQWFAGHFTCPACNTNV